MNINLFCNYNEIFIFMLILFEENNIFHVILKFILNLELFI